MRFFKNGITMVGVAVLVCVLPAPVAAATEIHGYLMNGNGKCLGVAGGSTAPGAAVVQWKCVPTFDQDWLYYNDAWGVTHLMSNAGRSGPPNMCLAVAGASRTAGAHLVLWYCNTGETQPYNYPDKNWSQTEIAGYPSFQRDTGTGMCLAIAAGSQADGVPAVQWPCMDVPDHHWWFLPWP